MSKKRAWKDNDRIPPGLVPEELKEDGSYGPGGGYLCRLCGFITKKKGFSGRQALRAHLKAHKLERRSWQRPLIRQTMVTGVLALVALSAKIRIFEPSSTIVVFVSPPVHWSVLGAMAVIFTLAVVASVQPQMNPNPAQLRLLLVGRGVSISALMYEAAWNLGIVSGIGSWRFHLVLWTIGILGIWLAVARGRAKYALTRRRRRPQDYGELFKARAPSARFRLALWLQDRSKRLTRRTGKSSAAVSPTKHSYSESNRPVKPKRRG